MRKSKILSCWINILTIVSMIILYISCSTPSYQKGVDYNKQFLLNHSEDETLVLFFINNDVINTHFAYCIVTNESDQKGVLGELLKSFAINKDNKWAAALNPVVLSYSVNRNEIVAGFKLPKRIKKVSLISEYGYKGMQYSTTPSELILNEKPEQFYLSFLRENNGKLSPVVIELNEKQMKEYLNYAQYVAVHYDSKNPKKQIGHISQ